MHASFLIAGLAASVAYASPLNVRSNSGAPWTPGNAPNASVPAPPPSGAVPPSATSQLGVPTAQPNPAAPSGLVASLLTAPNNVGRFEIVRQNLNAGAINLKFDFNPSANPGVTPGAGGQVDLASRSNFPILTTQGLSAATIFFQPCGLNTPHIHPRAAEFFTLTTPSKLGMRTGFVMENAQANEFNTTITQYQGTLFPQGSIHWQQNLDCEPAVGVAGLNSEDPGASSIAQNFLKQTSADILDATLGFPSQIDADNFAQFRSQIPSSLAMGVQECLHRCNIKY
jgi:Cupin